ncbi:MAG TPA: PEP-CTERM sorting domain-containing protein [Verrucomicrobiae bacterium]|jgi:hypothetical protein|nr:PEP-CTERM sorting domain-containing protein [Verrucomicrobiae bacterium]
MLKTLKGGSVVVALLGGMAFSASAQVTGLYDLNIFIGNNLIANQLTTGGSDTLDTVLFNGVANGSTFQSYNTATGQLSTASVFNSTTETWSIDYPFAPNGLGGVFDSPTAGTVRFSGNIVNIDNQDNYSFNPPVNGPGTYLLAMAAPLGSDSGNGTFQQIVGRNPVAGESVQTYGPQGAMITTTFNGSTWDNGTPGLAVGQAAYFTLGAATPEPSTYALFAMGAGLLVFTRRFSLSRSRS